MNDMTPPRKVHKVARPGAWQYPPLPLIPRRRYLDEGFYKAEIEHVFRKTWLLVGHVSEYEKAGSYRLLDIELAPVILVRGRDGTLRAFLNSCQHRGATVLKDKTGCAKVMSCQYHGWVYDLEGKLVDVPDIETFPGLNMADHRLVSLRCELAGGLIFINFDKDAQPLAEFLTPSVYERYAGIYGSKLRVVFRNVTEFNCNWKLSVDAFRESYHFETIHLKTVAQMADYRGTLIEMHRNGHGVLTVPYWPPEQLNQTDWDAMPNLSALPMLAGADGPDFTDGVRSPDLFPNTSMAFQTIGFPVVSTWPVSVDRCRVTIMWLGVDWGDGPQPAEWDTIITGHAAVIAEDLGNLISMQKAIEADPDRGIPLATQEVLVYQLHAEIDRLIGAENVPEKLRVPDILGDYYS